MTREEFIVSNIGLVRSCVNRFKDKGIEYDDLFSAGCLGLVKAADGFKSEKGFCFSTYAVPVILGEIKRLFRDGGALKVSRSLKDRARKAHREKEKLESELGREPTVKELATAIGCDEYETAELLSLSLTPISLTCITDGGERQLDLPAPSSEDSIHNALALRQIIKGFDEDDRKLIELRYYKGLTQSVTAQNLGISQVQVSRREKRLLENMRQKLTG